MLFRSSESKITRAEIDEILKLLESADHVRDFHLKYGDVELRVSRDAESRADRAGETTPQGGAAAYAAPAMPEAPKASAQPSPRPGRQRDAAIPPGMVVVKAPMVGTFYRAPSPGAPVVAVRATWPSTWRNRPSRPPACT